MKRTKENVQVTPTPPKRPLLDPFDVMRATRALAPRDGKLSDIRWLIGEALRRVSNRAQGVRVVGAMGFPTSQIMLNARDKMRAAERIAGAHAWPIVTRIILEGGTVRECRGFVPEIVTPWRADAVVTDRLRVALDALGPLMGITASSRTP